MHSTSRILLRLTTLSGPELSKQIVRLSPQASKSVQAKKTTRETFNETAKQILAKKANDSINQPENLRIEVADKKKTMFWRVCKRDKNLIYCEMMTLTFLNPCCYDFYRYPNPKDRLYVKYFEKDDIHWQYTRVCVVI